jgi:hypothetical protein
MHNAKQNFLEVVQELFGPDAIPMARAKPKVDFEPARMKFGTGWCVRVMFAEGLCPQLGGFKTEEEARDWINRKSAAWLKQYEGDQHA